MNAVEIEEAISALAEQPFDAAEFPFAFLEAFGNKSTTIKRLRTGASNKSDLSGVLQPSNIHIKVSRPGSVADTMAALKNSPSTARAKAKFVLATDGQEFRAEDQNSGDVITCDYTEFPDHVGFFLPLAGISTVKQIRESSFDIRATGRLNRLYVELLKSNPNWETAERRHDMNHFMARLIFCFFAEDTGIFQTTGLSKSLPMNLTTDQSMDRSRGMSKGLPKGLFTDSLETMSAEDGSNTHEIIGELFRAMNTNDEDRADADIAPWAHRLPYVNGGFFSLSADVPRFSRVARTHLLQIGSLNWTRINPDIFGSMIQAVADDNQRGALGMHYTSVPNILRLLNPLFLDDLRRTLRDAGENPHKLLALRDRLARIRVFDPACGSGNFLVVTYKEMRAIEATVNGRLGARDRRTEIPLTNFRGIEINDFPAEIARLALIIAAYQCDVIHRGQGKALAEFLPLDANNWITCGNALKLDWLGICPPTGTEVRIRADDLFHTPSGKAQIEFENEGGETYICGNPPYIGYARQNAEQKSDLANIFRKYKSKSAAVDYVSAWFVKAAEYNAFSHAPYAFVTTNSMWQGRQVPVLWPVLKELGADIVFAEPSFKWRNLASHNAGVIVSIVGVEHNTRRPRFLVEGASSGQTAVREVSSLNAYLIPGPDIVVDASPAPINGLSRMLNGNQPRDGGHLCLEMDELRTSRNSYPSQAHWFKQFVGAAEMINGKPRGCIWIPDSEADEANLHEFVGPRLEKVRLMRAESSASSTRSLANRPHRFAQIQGVAKSHTLAVAKVSSERRRFIPANIFDHNTIISDLLFGIYDAPLWNFAIVSSSLHTVWISAVCGKLKTDYRYSNTLGWNTFPVPGLTQENKSDLAHCAEDILLARRAHSPATIADLYDDGKMPGDLRAAHERNDEVLEHIYIGGRFKNDTERIKKLFQCYSSAIHQGTVI